MIKNKLLNFFLASNICVVPIVYASACSTSSFIFHGEISKQLYYVEYSDYDIDTNLETLQHQPIGACTTIRIGNIYGRNFDNYFNSMPEFVVKVKKNKNRHASIGVANHYGLRDDPLNYKPTSREIKLLPNHMMDGINDCGVVCNCNTVFYENYWDKWDRTQGSDTDAKDLQICFMPRYILDNADSAINAIELLKHKCNIYGSKQVPGSSDTFLMHMMIADQYNTFVVEFMNNNMIVLDFSKTKNVNPIMTNFYLYPLFNSAKNNDILDRLLEHPVGLERYQIVDEKYKSIEPTVNGVWKVMQEVKFSKFYDEHMDDIENFWFSEHFEKRTIQIYFKYLSGGELTDEELLIVKWCNEVINNFRTNTIPAFKCAFENQARSENNGWDITLHTSVYDMTKLELTITSQEEKYDSPLIFSLMK